MREFQHFRSATISEFTWFHFFSSTNRLDILMYECLCLGFLIGFISYYHYLPVLLIFLLCVQLLGTLHSANGFHRLVLFSFGAVRRSLFGIYQNISKITLAQPIKKASKTKSIPQEYLYNYHLKPTNDLRLQQVWQRLLMMNLALPCPTFSHRSVNRYLGLESWISMARRVRWMRFYKV